MNNTVNETLLMEMIWRELESLRRVRAVNEYNSFLASQQYRGPMVDKLFNNTCEYLLAMASVEGVPPDAVMEQAVRDSIQAHVAHFIEKQPQLINTFSPTEIAGLKNYAMRKVMMDDLIGSVMEIEIQNAPAPGERDLGSKRRRRQRAGSSDQPATTNAPEDRNDSGPRRRKGSRTELERAPTPPPKRASIRESITPTGAKPMPAKAQPQKVVEAPVENIMKTGVIIKRLEGQEMDYHKHQSVKIFDTSKPAPDRPKNFEAQVRMAPLVRPVLAETFDEPDTIEVLDAGSSETEYEAIPLLKNQSPMIFSVTAACVAARSEIRNSEFNVPGRQTGIVEFEVLTPVQYFEDPTSANIAMNEHYLFPLLNYKDQNEFGIVEWHARLEHAVEMSDCAMATALLTQLDRLATVEFNNFLKYTLGLQSSIDSFIEDFHDFYAAVSKSMTVPVLDALLGEAVEGVRNNDVAGAMLVKRIADVRILPQSLLSSGVTDTQGVTLCIVQPVSVMTLGANSSELQFATTSSDYNSITAKYVKDEPHVISGLLRMFTAALLSRKESSVYLCTNDNDIFHIRDMTRIEDGTPVLHLGIKYLTNPFTLGL
jgi:hypothetical protein